MKYNGLPSREKKGFTLVELLFVIAIVTTFVCLMLKLFIDVSAMADLADSKTMAYMEAQNTLEQMRWYPFEDLANDYANNIFPLSSINGTGTVSINSATSTQVTATLTVCWRERMGRVIGEDSDLDGVLDSGEDANGNGAIDSPVQITAIIANYD